MLLTEYDEKKHFRTLFREGKEEGMKEGMEKGRLEGREEMLEEQITKKLSKGKTIPEIAEDLEVEISIIEQMILKI